MRRANWTLGVAGAAACLALILAGGCGDEEGGTTVIGGTTVWDYVLPPPPDLTKATFVGTDTCMTCHPRRYGEHARSGHNYKLNEVVGHLAPTYPYSSIPSDGGPRSAGGSEVVDFRDIAFVIGGYGWKARYIASDGYIFTDERTNADLSISDGVAQYNLVNTIVGGGDNWSSYSDAAGGPVGKPYDCGRCHTTGWQAGVNADHDGILGNWDATGIQCERCHGNGSMHVAAGLTDAERRDRIVKNSSSGLCGECHVRNTALWNGIPAIEASGGFIMNHEQYEELQASGAHASLDCVSCHEPHRSTLYDNGSGCYASACHTTGTTASGSSHFGKTFVRTGYSEDVTCVSCHMPFASKSAIAATEPTIIGTGGVVTGAVGRIGDLHTHIFSINTSDAAYDTMIDSTTDPFGDGKALVDTTGGAAAVTMDFACLRCHNDGTAISVPAYKFSVATAAKFAPSMHKGHFDSGDSSPFRLHGDPVIEGACITCHGGQAGLDAHVAGGTAVTGTLMFTNGSMNVQGQTGVSEFTTQLRVGDGIRLDADGAWYEVDVITDDDSLVLGDYYAAAGGTGAGSFLIEVPSSRGLTCQTCHTNIAASAATRTDIDSVTFPNGNSFVDDDNPSNACITCHAGRRPMPDYIDGAIAAGDFGLNRPHHHGVAYALFGSAAGGGYEYTGKTYTGKWAHAGGSTNDCTYCHKAGDTGHTFDVNIVFTKTASCSGCHSAATVADIRKATKDYDLDGDYAEPMEVEIEGLKAAMADALSDYAAANSKPRLAYHPTEHRWYNDPDGDGVVTDTSRDNRYDADLYFDGPMMKAAYNYAMAGYRVPDSWAHNHLYVAQLLLDSIEDLGANVDAYKTAGGGWDARPSADLYVDGTVSTTGDGSSGSPFKTIQEAIDDATAGDVVNVAAADYVEDLLIDKALTLRGADKATTTVTGVLTRPDSEWPMVVPNMDIKANDVTIHNFTIKSPVVTATQYSGCITLTGTDIEIYDCDFKVATGYVSTAIQTYQVGPAGLQDISGLHIHDCTFTNLTPSVGDGQYEGIYINTQVDAVVPTNPVVIENNTFSGKLIRAITTERSSTIIRGNALSTDATPLIAGVFPMGILVREYNIADLDDVSVLDNTIVSGSEPFEQGIIIGKTGETLDNIVATGNTVQGCTTFGIVVDCLLAADDDVVINNNSITGNADGLEFAGTAGGFTVDAENNWWGATDGPSGTGSGSGDTVSADVDYQPFLTATP